MLISSAAIAYMGPFTAHFRSGCIKDWAAKCKAAGIPCSDDYSLTSCMGDPVQIRK